MQLSEDKIWENIQCMLDNFKFKYVVEKEHKFIEILNTHYKLVFDTATRPWRCRVLQFSNEIYSGNPTGAITFLNYVMKEKGQKR